MQTRWAALAAVTLSVSMPAAATEIWLAAGSDCNTCELFEQAAERRGYGSVVEHYAGGTLRRVPIRRIDKAELPETLAAQLPPASSPDDESWPYQLTVMVVDGDELLASGNIADSADMHELTHAREVMFPPAQPAADNPARQHQSLYAPFFRAHWNLEYFLDVAFGKAPREAVRLVDLQSATDVVAPDVILWGSAATPLANAAFIPRRLLEALELFDVVAPQSRVVTLFGHGPQTPGRDSSYLVDGDVRFRRADVPRDYSARASDLNAVLTAVARRPGHRTLLVQIGHSGRAGSPLWGHGLTLLPDDLRPLKADGQLVMVSGACHGGMFAEAVSCGFFAAHPEVTATGCQLSDAAIAESQDYLRSFFDRIEGDLRRQHATTFREAHWHASVRLEDHQISYSTSDAVVDHYFARHPDALPDRVSVAWLHRQAALLPAAEADALDSLTASLDPELTLSLTDHVERNHEAERRLAGARELSSRERGARLSLPYKLALPQLARRIVYRSLALDEASFAMASACEARTIVDLVTPRRSCETP